MVEFHRSSLFLSITLAIVAATWSAMPAHWAPTSSKLGERTTFKCGDQDPLFWSWSDRSLRLDSLGAFEGELLVKKGELLEISGIELVARWPNSTVGFDRLLPSRSGERQRVALAPVWIEGDDPDLSVSPDALELHWVGSCPNEAELELSHWRWLSSLKNPDEIGKMGPYQEMVDAMASLKEGAMPPYSGVRGERVEKARRIHRDLWKRESKTGALPNNPAKWSEGRRWMAQAWVLNGPTSTPTPNEERGFWVQRPDRTLPGLADSLFRAGATLIIEEGWTVWDTLLVSSLKTASKEHGIEWVPLLSWGILPQELLPSELQKLDSAELLQRDPNGLPFNTLSLCSEEALEWSQNQFKKIFLSEKPKAIALQDLELQNRPEADYSPHCHRRFAEWLTQQPDRVDGAELLQRWPGTLFPDSALAADYEQFHRQLLDSTVGQFAKLFRANGVELWIVVGDDAALSSSEKGASWNRWGQNGWIDRLIPKLFEAELGRFRVRLERLIQQKKAIETAQRKPFSILPSLTLWETATWSERQELAQQLEQIRELRQSSLQEGFVLFTANAAWLRHDAAWLAKGALKPPAAANKPASKAVSTRQTSQK